MRLQLALERHVWHGVRVPPCLFVEAHAPPISLRCSLQHAARLLALWRMVRGALPPPAPPPPTVAAATAAGVNADPADATATAAHVAKPRAALPDARESHHDLACFAVLVGGGRPGAMQVTWHSADGACETSVTWRYALPRAVVRVTVLADERVQHASRRPTHRRTSSRGNPLPTGGGGDGEAPMRCELQRWDLLSERFVRAARASLRGGTSFDPNRSAHAYTMHVHVHVHVMYVCMYVHVHVCVHVHVHVHAHVNVPRICACACECTTHIPCIYTMHICIYIPCIPGSDSVTLEPSEPSATAGAWEWRLVMQCAASPPDAEAEARPPSGSALLTRMRVSSRDCAAQVPPVPLALNVGPKPQAQP